MHLCYDSSESKYMKKTCISTCLHFVQRLVLIVYEGVNGVWACMWLLSYHNEVIGFNIHIGMSIACAVAMLGEINHSSSVKKV